MDRAVCERGSYAFGRFRLDRTRRVLARDGVAIALTPTLLDTLLHLVENPARVVTKEEFLRAIWPGRYVGESNLTQTISKLRKALGDVPGSNRLIATVPGRGYRFTAEVRLTTQAVSPVTAPVASEPLLAVLAFENLSGSPEMSYFSDGLSEDILHTVARGADIKVIGRGSSFQFRGAAKAAANIATELKATHVLDGSVRRSGDRVRIAAHLIECKNETTLWTGRFDRDLTDVFALQDEIAGAAAAALEIAFAPAMLAIPINVEAYDLYLRSHGGEGLYDDGYAQIKFLEQSVRLAPEFAGAWAALARARAWNGRYETPGGLSTAAKAGAIEAIQTALRLDPRSGLAFIALSHVEPYGRYLVRERFMRRALAVAPNDAAILAEVAGFCSSVGRHQEAIGFAARACQVDPLLPRAVNWHAICLFEIGEKEQSLELFESARNRWPEVDLFLGTPLQMCAFRGEWKAFDILAEQAYRKQPSTPYIGESLFVGKALRDGSQEIQARVLRRLSNDLAQTGTVLLGALVVAYRLGLRDQVFELVQKASFEYLFEAHCASPSGRYNPSVIFSAAAELHRDPRFPHLCAKLGLSDYWIETGRWPDCADRVDYDFKAEARRFAGARVGDLDILLDVEAC